MKEISTPTYTRLISLDLAAHETFFPLLFGLKKSFLQKKRHDNYGWRCSLLWTMQNLHMNSRIKHVHTWKSGNKQPLLCRKISAVKKNSAVQKNVCYAKNFLLAEKFLYAENSFMQKIFFYAEKFLYAENSFVQKIPLCRKFSFMQKKFFYAENYFTQKISFMQQNSFYTEKILLGMNLLQNNAHSWLLLLSRVILVPTIEWPFAQIITTLITEQITTK